MAAIKIYIRIKVILKTNKPFAWRWQSEFAAFECEWFDGMA